MSVISDNIRRLREREGIEQLELAERLGISNKTISSWECGRTEPRIGMIERIADALGCTKADIIEPETVTYMFKEAQLMTKGQRIRKARESKNMTQTEFANRLKISKQTLYKYEDVNNGVAHIHADMVKGTAGKWIYKEIPKTSESDRYISVDIGDGEGFVVDWTPDSITKRFIELRDRVGLSVRFHDLRHYFASSAALIMPDIYAADLGGWRRGSKILKGTYQNNIKPMSEYYEKKYDEHIDSIIGSR